MPSIHDWAAKAAHRIVTCERRSSVDRVAAVIAHFAEPLTTIVRDAQRHHDHCDDYWYCCGACDHPDHDGEPPAMRKGQTADICDCGAQAWNDRIEEALSGGPIK